jgi:hypothetical protein
MAELTPDVMLLKTDRPNYSDEQIAALNYSSRAGWAICNRAPSSITKPRRRSIARWLVEVAPTYHNVRTEAPAYDRSPASSVRIQP